MLILELTSLDNRLENKFIKSKTGGTLKLLNPLDDN